jgi:23S rRNA (cytidine1920-2'-O)/16S rRNA (cytidine1409-2'-O)-methyltransferase
MSDRSFRDVVNDLRSQSAELRGAVKLRSALDAFGVVVADRVCLDVGASTGGFTSVLLERGAAKVYAVDAGHGQLLGSLRQDARVVNLENTNIADLSRDVVRDPIDLFTVDVSYLSLSSAVAQLSSLVEITHGATLVGLVKPMFELRLAQAPTDEPSLDRAIEAAREGAESAGWNVTATLRSPNPGAKGALEGFIYASWSGRG